MESTHCFWLEKASPVKCFLLKSSEKLPEPFRKITCHDGVAWRNTRKGSKDQGENGRKQRRIEMETLVLPRMISHLASSNIARKGGFSQVAPRIHQRARPSQQWRRPSHPIRTQWLFQIFMLPLPGRPCSRCRSCWIAGTPESWAAPSLAGCVAAGPWT